MKAVWENTILAESTGTVIVEGNHYFPPNAIRHEYFFMSPTHITCPWKGIASYYHVKVGEKVNHDAAWFYPEPKQAAGSIKDHVAFWRGVRILD